jgi:thiamine-phosphate pyrophosphorylase
MCKVDWPKVMAVTNRHLCQGDFLAQVEKIASRRPGGILLREKDLPEEAYASLAQEVATLCKAWSVPLYLHTFPLPVQAVRAAGLHLPLMRLRQASTARELPQARIGASCHSVAEVQEAAGRGCSYVIAGHIYATSCKEGLPGRGLSFLQSVCRAAGTMPVYAIGGITPDRMTEVLSAGAAGVCVMSGMMRDSEWWR